MSKVFNNVGKNKVSENPWLNILWYWCWGEGRQYLVTPPDRPLLLSCSSDELFST